MPRVGAEAVDEPLDGLEDGTAPAAPDMTKEEAENGELEVPCPSGEVTLIAPDTAPSGTSTTSVQAETERTTTGTPPIVT